MTPVILRAVLDTLLPGDEGSPALPQASVLLKADLARFEKLAEPVVAALGDADVFLKASAAEREARLAAAERAAPEPFRALLSEVLAAYYESARVSSVLGWRSEPPQPQGHSVPPADADTLQNLEKVRKRGQLWRS